ncbi:hypothetical protein [Paenibacillus allorhizoplanae]|uniref:hypothetical protein n=1 Tax=Paenibacillus allorhizoplanae TaxID=2905648 RepID=UPI001F1918C1|nr:hypothetical protein [Paenibacillus allorhizoplanae]
MSKGDDLNLPENNASIEKDGNENVLVLEAKKESLSGHDFTSGKLTYQMKGDWTYGKFEVRAKLLISKACGLPFG